MPRYESLGSIPARWIYKTTESTEGKVAVAGAVGGQQLSLSRGYTRMDTDIEVKKKLEGKNQRKSA